jgi:hypothetical protein
MNHNPDDQRENQATDTEDLNDELDDLDHLGSEPTRTYYDDVFY